MSQHVAETPAETAWPPIAQQTQERQRGHLRSLADAPTRAAFGAECAEGQDQPNRTVLGRVVLILDAFKGESRVLGLSELSRRTGLPKSTLHRLAEQLCTAGWIQRASGGYRVGLGLFEIGNLAVEGTRLHSTAVPRLQTLAARTGMAAQLAVADGSDIVYLDRVAHPSMPMPTRRGGRYPAYCTALGKALAAFDPDTRDEILEAPMPVRTPQTLTSPSSFLAEVHKAHEAGVAFDRGESHPSLACVAAPILHGNQVIAAVSVTGRVGGVHWASAAEAVRSAADAIHNAMYALSTPRQRSRH